MITSFVGHIARAITRRVFNMLITRVARRIDARLAALLPLSHGAIREVTAQAKEQRA
jgi:hypothetical protein